MSEQIKQYVSVNEWEFWKKESLKITIDGSILPNALKWVVWDKVAQLNRKIDEAYNVSWLNFDKWENKIWNEEKRTLIQKLKTVVQGFNEEIARIDKEYIWKTKENQSEIKKEVADYFSDKSLFVERWSWLASALKWYASMDAEAVKPHREKEVSLK